jgi:anti-sigma B factor antagonist
MVTDVEHVGEITVATVSTDYLDAGNSDDFRHELAPVLKDCRVLILDLRRVQFVDSRGCGAILSCLKQVAANGGDLKLCHVSPQVRTVFDLIRLHRICAIHDTREEALQAFAQEGKRLGG